MTLIAPINDRGCLSQLVERAKVLARTPEAAALADELRTLPRVVDWYRALSQEDDDGNGSPDAIHCDVDQRARAFPSDPNCFERTYGFLALAQLLAPKLRFTAITVETPGGRHTAPVLVVGRRLMVVDLTPRPRNAEWYQDVIDALHTVGRAVLTFYGGAGGAKLADQVGEWEQDAGLRPPAPLPAAPAQPKQSPPTKTPAPSVTLKPLPVDKEGKWVEAVARERPSAPDRGTETARTTDAPRPPSSSSASSSADEPPRETPSTARRFGLGPSASERESEVEP